MSDELISSEIPVRIIIQARTNSNRLPAKALLPVAGMPLVVLAARRLARSGSDVCVATSDQPGDDALATTVTASGINVVRGALDDVMARFILAAQDLPDDAIIVRATGDNLFADADFADLLVTSLATGGEDIVGTRSPDDGLPYGLSLEAFRAGALRGAAKDACADYEREHVTPYLWRKSRTRLFDDLKDEINLARLRCTVDNLDDYLAIMRVFRDVADPVSIGWRDLIKILARQPDAAPLQIPTRKIGASTAGTFVLGTAQLGMTYGSVTPRPPPTPDNAKSLVRHAISCGVTHIDTAHAYGDSEVRIGAALSQGWSARCQVMTKLDPLNELPSDAPRAYAQAVTRASILQSIRRLGLPTLSTVMLHRWAHRKEWDEAVWDMLIDMRQDGIIGSLGVSVADPAEALEAIADPDIKHIQLACNIFDDRWDAAGVPLALAARPDIIVHARSILLQGVLASTKVSDWPRIDGLDSEVMIDWLVKQAARLERKSVVDLCISYMHSLPWLSGIVIGIEAREQLDHTMEMFLEPLLTLDQIAELAASRPAFPKSFLNPALWPTP